MTNFFNYTICNRVFNMIYFNHIKWAQFIARFSPKIEFVDCRRILICSRHFPYYFLCHGYISFIII